MLRVLASAGFGFVVLALPARAQPVDLGPLIGTFDKTCDFSESFLAFRESVARYDEKKLVWVPATPKTPAGLGAAIRTPTVAAKKTWSEIRVPATGTWKGLRVVGFEFHSGHENGIASLGIVFAERLAVVRSVLGADWSEKGKTVEPRDGAPYSYGLKRTPVNVVAYCDVST